MTKKSETPKTPVVMTSGNRKGETLHFSEKRYVQKEIDLDTGMLHVNFANGNGHSISITDLADNVQTFCALQGLSSVTSDAYASALSVDDKEFKFKNKLDSLRDGHLTIRRATGANSVDLDVLRAVVKYRDGDYHSAEVLETYRVNLIEHAKTLGTNLEDFLSQIMQSEDLKKAKAAVILERKELKAAQKSDSAETIAARNALDAVFGDSVFGGAELQDEHGFLEDSEEEIV